MKCWWNEHRTKWKRKERRKKGFKHEIMQTFHQNIYNRIIILIWLFYIATHLNKFVIHNYILFFLYSDWVSPFCDIQCNVYDIKRVTFSSLFRYDTLLLVSVRQRSRSNKHQILNTKGNHLYWNVFGITCYIVSSAGFSNAFENWLYVCNCIFSFYNIVNWFFSFFFFFHVVCRLSITVN